MAVRPLAALVASVALLASCSGKPPELARPAVFEVAVADQPGPDDVATAFALGPGRVLTVAHVLQRHRAGSRIYLRAPGERSGGRPATVVTVDERDDLAMLSVPGLGGARQATGTTAGDAVILALRGRRVQTLPAHVLRAIVARIRTANGSRIVKRPALELRAEVLPGDSGAPVLTVDGHLAGVVFARANAKPEIAFAVSATVISTMRNTP